MVYGAVGSEKRFRKTMTNAGLYTPPRSMVTLSPAVAPAGTTSWLLAGALVSKFSTPSTIAPAEPVLGAADVVTLLPYATLVVV